MAGVFGDIDLHNMFPVPLLVSRLGDPGDLDARLAAEAARRRSAEAGVDRSNRYGWHSQADFFERPEPAHSELAAAIRNFVAEATAKFLPRLPDGVTTRFEGWINVSPTHAMNAPHDHVGTFWSGTYYVAVPLPTDLGDKTSGAIEFLDPRGSLGSNAGIVTPITRGKFTLRPAAGTLLLWPGYVRHWVYPNMAEEERVTVSFNAWYGPARA